MGFFDKLFGTKKVEKPEAIAVTTEKGAVYAPAAGKVEPMSLWCHGPLPRCVAC